MSNVDLYKSIVRPGEHGWATRQIPSQCAGCVSVSDVRDMLLARIAGKVSAAELLDWANLVLFNDAFDFNGDEIRDVLDRIEESDEPDNELTLQEIESLLKTL